MSLNKRPDLFRKLCVLVSVCVLEREIIIIISRYSLCVIFSYAAHKWKGQHSVLLSQLREALKGS